MEEILRIDGAQVVGAGETPLALRAPCVSPARGGAKERSGTADVEVLAKAMRRQFSAEYKRRILREAAAAREAGEIGALLRREGLYSSYLNTWRHQRVASVPRRRIEEVLERARTFSAGEDARNQDVAAGLSIPEIANKSYFPKLSKG